jgi:hypothetical protein
MDEPFEIDQFRLLEEKIDSLIDLLTAVRNEKMILAEKVQTQENRIAELSGHIEKLKKTQDSAKQRIVSLLEKLEQVKI